MAKLYFSYSAMNAGKSTMLLQAAHNYQERGMSVMLLTTSMDDRAQTGVIHSRIGISMAADLYRPEDDIFALVAERHARATIHCLFVDEAHFLTAEQGWQLARIADRLDVPVMAYGLRTDFLGRLFPGSQTLLAIADDLREVRTICRCGRKATMVVRLDDQGHVLSDGAQYVVGGNDRYVSLCRRHWEEEMGRVDADDMFGFLQR